MIMESAVAIAGGGLAFMYLSGRDKRKIMRAWRETLLNCKSDNVKLSKSINNKTVYKTYMLNKIHFKPYGWLAMCNIPRGLTFTALEKAKESLEVTFGAKIEFEKKTDSKSGTYVQIKCINKEMCNVDFKPYKTKPHELLLGLELDGSAYRMSLIKDPHLLIIGANGTGKSYLLASILTNVFHNNKNNFEVLGMQYKKNDLDRFSKLFKCLGKTIDEILALLQKIENTATIRNMIFFDEGVNDIAEYNELNPKKAMKRILVVVEEIFFMMPQPYDSDEIINSKNQCLAYFMSIAKAGRSCGIHFIATTQRATVSNLPSDVKQECSKIALHMKSEKNSENAIDIPDARYLKERQFIFDGNLEVTTLTVPIIDKHFEILNSYVPEIKIPSRNFKEDPIQSKTFIEYKDIKYGPEKSVRITPEEYFKKTGYIGESLKGKVEQPNSVPKPTDQPVITAAKKKSRTNPKKNKDKEVAVDVNAKG